MNELSLSMDMAMTMAVKMALYKITVATVSNAYACLRVFRSIKAVFANFIIAKKIVNELSFWLLSSYKHTHRHIYTNEPLSGSYFIFLWQTV